MLVVKRRPLDYSHLAQNDSLEGSGVLDKVISELSSLGINLASKAAMEVLEPLAKKLGKGALEKLEQLTGVSIGSGYKIPGYGYQLPGHGFRLAGIDDKVYPRKVPKKRSS